MLECAPLLYCTHPPNVGVECLAGTYDLQWLFTGAGDGIGLFPSLHSILRLS